MGSGKAKAERKNHLSHGSHKRGKLKPSLLKWRSVSPTKDRGVERPLSGWGLPHQVKYRFI